MNEVFVDTAGWANLFDEGHNAHAEATKIYRALHATERKFITTNYVLTELVALLTSPMRLPRSKIILILDKLKASPSVEIVHIDQALDAEGWALLRQRPDKQWSLVDCSSFVLMRQRSLTEALTTDHPLFRLVLPAC